MQQAITWDARGRTEDHEVKDALLALRKKGEAVSELVGASRAMRMMMTPIRTQRKGLVDTCGQVVTAHALSTSLPQLRLSPQQQASPWQTWKPPSDKRHWLGDVLHELGVKIDAPGRSSKNV